MLHFLSLSYFLSVSRPRDSMGLIMQIMIFSTFSALMFSKHFYKSKLIYVSTSKPCPSFENLLPAHLRLRENALLIHRTPLYNGTNFRLT